MYVPSATVYSRDFLSQTKNAGLAVSLDLLSPSFGFVLFYFVFLAMSSLLS